MSKDSIQEYSLTAASNTDVGGTSTAVGWAPGNVGTAVRTLMAQLAAFAKPATVTLTGSTVTLTAAQSSSQYIVFKGSPGANAVATIPANPSSGFIANFTTGGFTVEITTGSGSTITVPNNQTYAWTCDGTNVSVIDLAFSTLDVSTLDVSGLATLGTLDVSGAANITGTADITGLLTAAGGVSATGSVSATGTVSGAALVAQGLTLNGGPVGGNASLAGSLTVAGVATAANGTTGSQVVNFSQFPNTLSGSGKIVFPGGLVMAWTTSGTISAGGSGSASFAIGTFPTGIFFALANAQGAAGNAAAVNVVAGTPSGSSVPLYNWGSFSAAALVVALGH